MDINSLSLINSSNSKSISYKFNEPCFEINEIIINLLVKVAGDNKNKNCRFCFHSNSESLMQKMLIFERKKIYYPPHIHKNRDESHIVFHGALELFILDNNGTVVNRIVNSDRNKIISTVPPNFAHLTRPLTDYVIYLEMKNGPHKSFHEDCFSPNPYNKKMLSEKEYSNYLDQFID